MPAYRDSLLDLAGAVRAGLDPSVAYGLYSDMNSQHLQQVQMRKDKIQSLVDMVIGGAQSGMPMDQMQMVMAAQTGGGGMPPRVEDAMQTMFPPTEGLTTAIGDLGTGLAAGALQGVGMPIPQQQPTPMLSPGYQPDPAAQMEQQLQQVQLQNARMEQQQMIQQQQAAQYAGDLTVDAAKYAANGDTVQDFLKTALTRPEYQMLYNQDPEMFMKIVGTAFTKATP